MGTYTVITVLFILNTYASEILRVAVYMYTVGGFVFEYKPFLGVVDASFNTLVFRFLKDCVATSCDFSCQLLIHLSRHGCQFVRSFFRGVGACGWSPCGSAYAWVWVTHLRDLSSTHMDMYILRRLFNTGFKISKPNQVSVCMYSMCI